VRIDESIIQKLKRLEFRAKNVVEGFLLGLHPSPYHGYSSEFKEHREYHPFDEIKYIDWKLTARRERIFVKKFQEETNTKVYILLDASNSMDYGEPVKKIDTASEICAIFSYLSFMQRDAPGLYVFSEKIEKILPPRATKKHISIMFRTLVELKPYGKTEPVRIFRGLSEKIKRKGVVIIISDFLKKPEEFLKSIRYFKAKKHLVLVFHILSKEEITLKWRGPVTLKDMEYKQEYRVSERSEVNYLKREFLRNINFFENELLKSKIFYTRVLTDQNIEKVFLNFLYKYRRYAI
jgi:uncharacterized protein (DUF58 family)